MTTSAALLFSKIQIQITVLLGICLVSQGISAQEQQIREITIPMEDGVLLAADLYLPPHYRDGSAYPVLLEYLPYRKDEHRAHRFSLYSYFTKSGYIVARVDIRGTGRSQGKLVDGEYSEEELHDGEEVINWLSKASFSNGNIAMFGISWGGFNALQIAMRKPPALKTIISLMSTDDLYQDDVHFIDGMMHVDAYEIQQDLANCMPGAPDFILDDAYFANRFETEPWLLKYKQQQVDGPFWKRASLMRNYSSIDIPVFLIGGWYDGYRDLLPRMLRHADVPVKVLLGPWNHTWPNWAAPEPAVEWRDIAVRWLDHWLEGRDTGIMDEPAVVYYQRDWHPPGSELDSIPGAWKQSVHWPATSDTLLYPANGKKLSASPEDLTTTLTYRPSEGAEAGGSVMWWGDWAPDQAEADRNSMTFDSEPLSKPLEFLGFPKLDLHFSTDAPKANWLVRLSDVAPGGQVTLITGGGFNANHHQSAAHPVDLQPGKIYRIPIEMHLSSWTFRPGHRIRISISNAQWPMIWPSAYPMTATMHSSNIAPTALTLPINPVSAPLEKPFALPFRDPEPEGYLSLESGTGSGFAEVSRMERDSISGDARLIASNSGGEQYPWGKVFNEEYIEHRVNDHRPQNASVNSDYRIRVELPERQLEFRGVLKFSSDTDYYYYNYTRILTENGKELKRVSWDRRIPRL